ncbi:MAG: hypothetical protein DRJ05_10440 [Bacteroidetes bacterium]|nr:MAG: hypothetical protein DRJ05_10440 [Bacteroidota bacterium]
MRQNKLKDMKQVDKIKNESIYIEIAEMMRIANHAIQKAKQENRRYGIPEIFFKNGKLYYVLTDGNITTSRPEILK